MPNNGGHYLKVQDKVGWYDQYNAVYFSPSKEQTAELGSVSLRAAYRGVTIDNMSKRAFTSLKSLIDSFMAAEESVGALFHDTVISSAHTRHNYNGRHSQKSHTLWKLLWLE